MKACWAVFAFFFYIITTDPLQARRVTSSTAMTIQLLETAVFSSQKKKFNKEKEQVFLSMGSVSFDASMYDIVNRIKYSVVVDLTADMSTIKQQNPVLNAAYISVSGKLGELRIGNTFSAATELMIDGTQLLGGDGGFSGVSTFSVFNPAAYSIIMTGCYYDPGYASQVTYISPNFQGLQFGISYVPNSLHTGILPASDSFNYMAYGMTTRVDEDRPDPDYMKYKDLMAWGNGGFTAGVIAGGIRYSGGIPSARNFSLAVTFWKGRANPEKKLKIPYKIHDLQALSAGLTVGSGRIKLGFGYVNQFKSCLPKERSIMTREFLETMPKECWEYVLVYSDEDTSLFANAVKGNLSEEFKNAIDSLPIDLYYILSDYNGQEIIDPQYKERLINHTGFGKGADAGQIFTASISYLIGSRCKASIGGIYAVRKMAEKERTKTYGGSLAIDYRIANGVGIFLGATHLRTKTCRRAILIAMSEAKSCAPFVNNDITFVSLGVKMNF